jgi:prepilin-type N-terminal cleavage/methylation domain-containing protein
MPRRGLTLLELLVVLSILVALASLIIPNISFLGSKSQAVSTRENLQRLQELLVNRYIPDMGGNVYLPPTGGSATTNPYAGTNLGNMAANLPAPSGVPALLTFSSTSSRNATHPQLRYLFVNPDTETIQWSEGVTALSVRRWQGPYGQQTGATYTVTGGTATNYDEYGVNGDPTVTDAWGRPIVIQVPPATLLDPTTNEPGVNFARIVSAGPNGVIDTPEDVTMPTPAQRGDDVILFLFHNDPYGQGVPTLGP